MRIATRLVAVTAVIAVALTCGPNHGGARQQRKQVQASIAALESAGLELGEFQLTKVVDGDTIRVNGLDSSLRLLGLDAEETFKSDADRRGVEAGFDAYLKNKRGSSPRPTKSATPAGEAAKAWAVQFFAGVDRVRLERDTPTEIRDRYNRYLA